MNFTPRTKIILWQLLLLLLAATWLWAPELNKALSYRSSLISQYESPLQPYSWLFRLGDVLGGLLVILMALPICLSDSNSGLAGVVLQKYFVRQ
jgi:hypothetical protein